MYNSYGYIAFLFFMRPVDFIFPSNWEGTTPFLLDNSVYFLPKTHLSSLEKSYFFEFNQILQFLSKGKPIICELCSGNGDWVIEQAKKRENYFWIAVERRFDRIRKIWSKKSNHDVENLLIVYGDAFFFFHEFSLNESIHKIFINFPDPWPKKKHIKNRIINDLFVYEAHRVLISKGTLSLVTDDLQFLSYSFLFLKKKLIPCFPKPFYKIQQESFGGSWFEVLWRNKGKEIYYSEFKKNN